MSICESVALQTWIGCWLPVRHLPHAISTPYPASARRVPDPIIPLTEKGHQQARAELLPPPYSRTHRSARAHAWLAPVARSQLEQLSERDDRSTRAHSPRQRRGSVLPRRAIDGARHGACGPCGARVLTPKYLCLLMARTGGCGREEHQGDPRQRPDAAKALLLRQSVQGAHARDRPG